MFENRYTITKKLYVDWAKHPVILGSKSRRRFPLLLAGVLVVGSVMLVTALVHQDWKYSGMYAALLAAVLFRLFGNDAMLARQEYKKLRAGKDGDWDRVVCFEADQIRIRDDGKLLAVKEYDRVEEVRDLGSGLALILEGGVIVRLDKDGFYQNEEKKSAEEFTAFLKEKCPEAEFKA